MKNSAESVTLLSSTFKVSCRHVNCSTSLVIEAKDATDAKRKAVNMGWHGRAYQGWGNLFCWNH